MHLPAVFWSLLVVSVGLALVALVRQRPSTFIFAASQAMLLKSFLRFSEEGRPVTLLYTPQWVSAPDILSTAAVIVSISPVMLAFFLPWPRPTHPPDPPS